MIRINWNPMPYLGPLPINWYGMGVVVGVLVGAYLVWHWSLDFPRLREQLERLLVWIVVGIIVGARLYYVVQHTDEFAGHPFEILAIWEGGLAYFGGLFGGIAAAILYCRRHGLHFWSVADRFAPAIAVGSAIGRIACGLDGMDYGTPTKLPWGIIYTNPRSYAPLDGVPRHPDQFYELAGDLLIAGLLLRFRGRVASGVLFWSYLVMFSILRFAVFFVRGNVPPVALGLKNAQWTALAILAIALPAVARFRRMGAGSHTSDQA